MRTERVLTMVAVVLGSVALVGCQPKTAEKVELSAAPVAPVEQVAAEAEKVEAAAPAAPEAPAADKPKDHPAH